MLPPTRRAGRRPRTRPVPPVPDWLRPPALRARRIPRAPSRRCPRAGRRRRRGRRRCPGRRARCRPGSRTRTWGPTAWRGARGGPSGRSSAACSGVSRKSRVRAGAGIVGIAAAIERRSWWSAAQSPHAATSAVARSSSGPVASPAAYAAISSRSWSGCWLSGRWGISRPRRGTGRSSPRAGRAARADRGGSATSPCPARRP